MNSKLGAGNLSTRLPWSRVAGLEEVEIIRAAGHITYFGPLCEPVTEPITEPITEPVTESVTI
jgi:hypothetical protein